MRLPCSLQVRLGKFWLMVRVIFSFCVEGTRVWGLQTAKPRDGKGKGITL